MKFKVTPIVLKLGIYPLKVTWGNPLNMNGVISGGMAGFQI